MTEKYEKRLHELAELLVTPERFGAVAVEQAAEVIEFPGGAKLKTPVEDGWIPPSGEAA